MRFLWTAITMALALASFGCSAGFSSRTAAMRRALDRGEPRAALDSLNRELRVEHDSELPPRLVADDALLVLDRATIQHSLAQLAGAQRDYETADKALDMLDLSHGGIDEVGKWMFSDASGRYMAAPHEKLLVNALDMATYLETGDLSNARVEARRFAVMAKLLRTRGELAKPVFAFGALLAGFAAEKVGDEDDARIWYEDAARAHFMQFARIDGAPEIPASEDDGEILAIVGWGRVPHLEAHRVPIELALTRAASELSPKQNEEAGKLAAQGLVTWVSYPALAVVKSPPETPNVTFDGKALAIAPAVDVSDVVADRWKSIEGRVMAAALARAMVRVIAGKTVEALSNTSKDKGVRAAGLIASLVIQASMLAADTPDTRSWETLPARLAAIRIRMPAGKHRVALDARGFHREGEIVIPKGGFRVVSLLALR